MNIEKMKAFAQAQRESEESTEIRPAPKPAEPEYQPEAIYIPIEDDEPSEMPDDGFAAVSNEEEPELPEEINMELYLKMFMRYLHKNHKRLYLLVESEEEGQEAFRYLQKAYSGIQLVGLAKVSAEDRADDMLVNAINGSEVDCVLSALSVPLQEDFIAKNRNLLDARVWIGVGKKIFSPRKPGFGQGKIAKYLLNHIFRREMEKNKLKMKS